jgi:hypothetical protein
MLRFLVVREYGSKHLSGNTFTKRTPSFHALSDFQILNASAIRAASAVSQYSSLREKIRSGFLPSIRQEASSPAVFDIGWINFVWHLSSLIK